MSVLMDFIMMMKGVNNVKNVLINVKIAGLMVVIVFLANRGIMMKIRGSLILFCVKFANSLANSVKLLVRIALVVEAL